MLHVRVLQALALDAGGVAVPLPKGRRPRSLLAWLVVHPGLHPRARLAERFWPDVRDATARNSLRQALWEIRGALGPHALHLVASREEAGIVKSPGLWVDLWEFRSLVDRGRLEDALELAGGTLVEDVDDEWAYDAREEHRRNLVAVIDGAAREAEVSGDLSRAVERTRWLVDLDPYSEEGHRHLMSRLAAAGDVPGAIIVCDQLRDRLRRDLNLPLSQETRLLAEHLRAGGTAIRTPAMPAATSVQPLAVVAADEPFVGREGELARLRGILDLAVKGRRRIVLVEGDAGIGKTRLALELCRAGDANGYTVLFGRCTEETLVPYQPFVEALRRHVLSTPVEALRTALPHDAVELTALLPEIEEHIAVPATRAAAPDPATDRFRLFEAAVGLLHGLARATPVVLVLDDLHWADRPSLLLLRHLGRSPVEGPLLVIGTYRSGELDGNTALQDALADLRHQPVERLHLEGLSTSDVATLVSWRTGHAASDELVQMIERHTRGNPFFITEVLRNLTESGALSVRDARAVWDLASPDVIIPEGISSVISRRISRLGDLGRRVLEAASVAGTVFQSHVVADVVSVDAESLLDVLDAAVRAQLVSEVPGAAATYSFAHPMVREVLYHELTVNRCARLHQRVGEALERIDHAGASSAELARHFLSAQSGATADKATAYALDAAEQAMRQRAYEDAVALFDAALDRLPTGDAAQRRRVLSRRAVAHIAGIHAIIEPLRLPTATATAAGSRPQEQ